MPELDPLAIFQLVGLGLTWLAAVIVWFWRVRKSTGTDRDMLLLMLWVGGFVFLTLVQFIGLIIRLG